MSETPPADLAAPARRGTETRQRSRLVQVRCTEDELAKITAAAERAGLAVGAFMRRQAIGTPGPRAVRRPPIEKVELARLLGQLGKVGSNLNQLAYAANSGSEADAATLAATQAEVREAARAIMQALGRPL